MTFLKEIGEGEMFPRGYGIAYRAWYKNRTVCAPIPLNLIIGPLRDFYFWLRHREPTKMDIALVQANREGFYEGRKLGYSEGLKDSRTLPAWSRS